jgi:hypothetical protein
VDVDQGWPAGGLGKAVGHPDHRRLLKAEHVAEVRREILEKGLLGRADIAEHRRQTELSKQLIGDVAHALHIGSPPSCRTRAHCQLFNSATRQSPFAGALRKLRMELGGRLLYSRINGRRPSPVVVGRTGNPQREPEIPGLHGQDGVRVTPNTLINEIRKRVDAWRKLPSSQWA